MEGLATVQGASFLPSHPLEMSLLDKVHPSGSTRSSCPAQSSLDLSDRLSRAGLCLSSLPHPMVWILWDSADFAENASSSRNVEEIQSWGVKLRGIDWEKGKGKRL